MRLLSLTLIVAVYSLAQSFALAQAGGPKPDDAELKKIEERHVKAAAKLQQLYGHKVAILKAGKDGVFVCNVHFGKGDVMNPGLPLLKDLFNVKTIYAATARYDDNGENIEVLGELTELEDLQIYFTGFGDKSAKVISELPKLRHLSISSTLVTDEGIRDLAKLPNLEFLSLASTRVSDASLTTLGEMKKLRGLAVTKSQITAPGWQKFQQAHPEITEKAYWDFNAGQVGGGLGGGR